MASLLGREYAITWKLRFYIHFPGLNCMYRDSLLMEEVAYSFMRISRELLIFGREIRIFYIKKQTQVDCN